MEEIHGYIYCYSYITGRLNSADSTQKPLKRKIVTVPFIPVVVLLGLEEVFNSLVADGGWLRRAQAQVPRSSQNKPQLDHS